MYGDKVDIHIQIIKHMYYIYLILFKLITLLIKIKTLTWSETHPMAI